MTKNHLFTFLTLALIVTLVAQAADSIAGQPPNLLLIMADDVGFL